LRTRAALADFLAHFWRTSAGGAPHRRAGDASGVALDDDECEALTSALLNVFTARLGPDDEPDTYGAKADDVIGLIEMQRRGYWQQ
jgi:hypothetical protein